MIKVVSVKTMRGSDAHTISKGTPDIELMRRAAQAIYKNLPEVDKYAVICGKGNNGGDGFALAKILSNNGKNVTVYKLSDKLTDAASYYFKKCVDSGVKTADFSGEIEKCGVIVDCIFGTGFHGKPTGVEAEAIEKINESGAYVVSADINSGLNGDSGQGELCVISDLTVAIQFYKPGHFLGCAKDVIKKLVCEDIGIELKGEAYALCGAEDFKSVFPERKNDSHKGTYGTAVIAGGCAQYSGAVKLANLSLSALLCGCGISRLVTDADAAHAVMPYLLESTLYPVKEYNTETLKGAFEKATAAGMGMGFGRSEDRIFAVKYATENLNCPLLIDADGLYALSKIGYKSRGNVIITPHIAEFARLSGLDTETLLSDPIKYAREYALTHNAVVLLKGAATVITDGSRVFIVNRGCPGMATAGSGDVLSGIITGINSQNPNDLCLNAACGAWIAGVAGELAQAEKNAVSMTSSDTVRHIHEAVNEILNQSSVI